MLKRLVQSVKFEIGTSRKVCRSQVEAGQYTFNKYRKNTNTYLEILNSEGKQVKSMRATMFAKIIDVDNKFRREDPLVRDVTNQVLSSMMLSYMAMNGEDV